MHCKRGGKDAARKKKTNNGGKNEYTVCNRNEKRKNPLFFYSSIHCVNSKCKCLKINEIKPYLLSLFLA